MERLSSQFYFHPRRNGFSLLELVAVIAVIAILSGIALGVLDGVKERSQRSLTQAELSSIRNALESYRLEFGNYPIINSGSADARSTQLLNSLLGQLGPGGGSVSSGNPFINTTDFSLNEAEDHFVDAWDHALYYAFSDHWGHQNYFLLSPGPDGLADYPSSNGLYNAGTDENRDNLEGLD